MYFTRLFNDPSPSMRRLRFAAQRFTDLSQNAQGVVRDLACAANYPRPFMPTRFRDLEQMRDLLNTYPQFVHVIVEAIPPGLSVMI